MSYNNIKKLQKKLPEELHIDYSGQKLTEDLFQDLNDRFTSDPDTAEMIQIKEKHRTISSVKIGEVFECCAKAYLFGFVGEHYLDILIAVGVELAKNSGYSYIGLVHLKTHKAIDAGEANGFDTLITFKNERSGNTLREMALII